MSPRRRKRQLGAPPLVGGDDIQLSEDGQPMRFEALREKTWCSLCHRAEVSIGARAVPPSPDGLNRSVVVCGACVACLSVACHQSNEAAPRRRVSS